MPPSHDSFDGFCAALQADDHDAAFGLFRALVRQPPSTPAMAWLDRAWTAFRPREDRSSFARAIEAARTDALSARLLFAEIAFGAGHTAGGLAAARAAVAAAPTQPAPAFLLCVMLLKLGQPDAHYLLVRCLADFPQPSSGWTGLGDALLELGKKDAALVCFARGAPDYPLAMRRGLLAKELGRREEARAAFEEAVRLNAKSPRAWFLLGLCAQDARDHGPAIAAYRTALALAPTLAEAAVNLGTVLQETGDLAGAKAAYAQAIAIRPDTFGRVAQALTTSPKGELWLDPDALRRSLGG